MLSPLHHSATLAPAAGLCILPSRLYRMRLLVLLLLTLTLRLRADELAFETYSCAITMPAGETWQRGLPQPIKGGETIYFVTQSEQKELFAICILPNVPALELSTEVASIALRTLGDFGLQSKPPKLVNGKDHSYLQFIAKKPEMNDSVCVARAALHDKTLYLLVMIGPGDAEKADDKHFTRIMDTFHFLNPDTAIPPLTADPLFGKYRLGAWVCVSIAGALALLFVIVMFSTRRTSHY